MATRKSINAVVAAIPVSIHGNGGVMQRIYRLDALLEAAWALADRNAQRDQLMCQIQFCIDAAREDLEKIELWAETAKS